MMGWETLVSNIQQFHRLFKRLCVIPVAISYAGLIGTSALTEVGHICSLGDLLSPGSFRGRGSVRKERARYFSWLMCSLFEFSCDSRDLAAIISAISAASPC